MLLIDRTLKINYNKKIFKYVYYIRIKHYTKIEGVCPLENCNTFQLSEEQVCWNNKE